MVRGAPPVWSVSVTTVTTYLWNQSRIGEVSPGGVHFTGMQRSVFDSGADGIREPATQSIVEYPTLISPPVSVMMEETRHQFIGGELSTVLFICTPVKVTSGVEIGVPTRPVCVMPASHSPARVPSPGSGNVWRSVHDSTSRYALPPHTCVVTLLSRLVVQNVGETVSHSEPEQSLSHGTSGQWTPSCVAHPDRHRSSVVKLTRAAGFALYPVSVPERLSVP